MTRRVQAELRSGGERHGRKRIARLMREAHVMGAGHRRHGPVTTRRDKERRPAPDSVDRNFTASSPNQLRVAAITFVPTTVGLLYLAVVLDALEMAVGQRRPKDVIHHSDQGSRYTSPAFGKRCKEAGGRPSLPASWRVMGSTGDAYDHAMGQSFFSTLECELLARRRFDFRAEARMACFSSIRG
jgi:putative transposase